MGEHKLMKVDTCKNCKHFTFMGGDGERFVCMLGHKLKEKNVEGFYRGVEYSYHLDGPAQGFCAKEEITEQERALGAGGGLNAPPHLTTEHIDLKKR